jgi:carboxylesterase
MDNDAPEIFRGSAEFIRSLAAAGTPDARASQKDTADD